MVEITTTQQTDKYSGKYVCIRYKDGSCDIGQLIYAGWQDCDLNNHTIDFSKSRVFLIPEYS